ncbi:toll/interleukin-1 receptor domain-containing protein [Aurantiacibacter flavus]|uniref:Toll/interleukin-1 receptor domain-containing protein n=1 Tax=Aurantiacibacter flavus TaxID=3145232 RepID=A0ABV0D139_9SPHN
MAKYELVLLGSLPDGVRARLAAVLEDAVSHYELKLPADIAIRTAVDVAQRDIHASTAVLYFGGDPTRDADLVRELERARVPVIPVVPRGSDVAAGIPEEIWAVNAFFLDTGEGAIASLCALTLESLGLLRRQRRVFVSYRRDESRAVALQLHDELSARGFDVFLDTHDILPGDQFQEMLWHRLADCDVVIMLDTKDYFASKWTTQEIGRSLAQGIHILRLVWPDHDPTRHLSLSDMIRLQPGDVGPDGRLLPQVVDAVACRAEILRSRSVASRHREIAGTLRIEVERIGGRFEGIGAHRAMSLSLPNGLALQAYPVVGVPTAELLNDVHSKAITADPKRFPCLVYDHHGIRPAWSEHLQWLDRQVKDVRAIRVFDAGWELAEWDS